MESLPKFSVVKYKTTDGENIVATKNNGVVTLVGDKKGVRQMPLDKFMKEFIATLPKMERSPNADIATFSSTGK